MLGEALAIGCALSWAVSVVLFKSSERSGDVPAHALNLFKNTLAIPLLLGTMALLGEGFDLDRPAEDWVLLAISGILGIAVADTLYFVALRRIGAGLLAIVEMVYSPMVLLFSMVLLGETVGLAFSVGALLVLGGLLFATAQRGPRESAVATGGVAIGMLAASLMAFGIVLCKPALERSNLVEATVIRLVAGVAAHLVFLVARGATREVLAFFRPQPVWRVMVPGAVMGAYVSMLLWVGGMKYTNASTAALLNQLTVVFTLGLGALFLGEPLTRRRTLGGAAALAGGAVIVLAQG